MIFKIKKPVNNLDNKQFYLSYNKNKTISFNDIAIGDFPELDNMFKKNENQIYVEGYLDKKGRFIIKRKEDIQEW